MLSGSRTRLWRIPVAAAVVGLLALAIGHTDGREAAATGDGRFTAFVTVEIEGLEDPLECTIRGSLEGFSTPVLPEVAAEAWDVTDTLIGTSGRCPFGPPGDAGDRLQPRIDGRVGGRVQEKVPNGNMIADGMATGSFDIHLTEIESATLGLIHTDPDEPLQITCPDINLDSRPTTSYTCTLDGPPVSLYGSELEVAIVELRVEFTGRPVYLGGLTAGPATGFGDTVAGSSGVSSTLIGALAAAGAALVAGGGLLALRRR